MNGYYFYSHHRIMSAASPVLRTHFIINNANIQKIFLKKKYFNKKIEIISNLKEKID